MFSPKPFFLLNHTSLVYQAKVGESFVGSAKDDYLERGSSSELSGWCVQEIMKLLVCTRFVSASLV